MNEKPFIQIGKEFIKIDAIQSVSWIVENRDRMLKTRSAIYLMNGQIIETWDENERNILKRWLDNNTLDMNLVTE